jgi:DNA polymerase-1
MERVPAVAKLKDKVSHNVAIDGTLVGLDGRVLPIRSEHSALNTLLQSAGAILCKQWLCDAFDEFERRGYAHGWDGDFVFLGWIHDEVQVAVRNGIETEAASILTGAAEQAGEAFGFRVPLASDYKVGRNWAECH